MELQMLSPEAFNSSTSEKDPAVFWMKTGFIFVSFMEALVTGMIPTWSPSCRESPKILGIANSFAAGVFLAIALMHITPEMIELWNELPLNEGREKIFPLPEILIFAGYTIILIIDKVLFDTHALFDHDHEDGGDHGHDSHDPANVKLEVNIKASLVRAQNMNTSDPALLKKSRVEEREDMEGAMKSYLNPHDRFATRMKASMTKSSSLAQPGSSAEQENLFVDGANVNLH